MLALFCLRVLLVVLMGFPCQASDCGRCFSGCLGQHRHTAHVHNAQTSTGCETINAICVESDESDEPGGRAGSAICIESDESSDLTVARGTAATTGTFAEAKTCSAGGAERVRDVVGLEVEVFLELARAKTAPAPPPKPSPRRGRARRGALSESSRRSCRADAQNRHRGRRRRNPVGGANPADGAVGDNEDSVGAVVDGAHGRGGALGRALGRGRGCGEGGEGVKEDGSGTEAQGTGTAGDQDLCEIVFDHYERFGDAERTTTAFPPLRGDGSSERARDPWVRA